MANFSNLITTSKGHELIVRILAGEIRTEPQTPFTRIVTSSAVYQTSELEGLTTIHQIQQETLISSVTRRNQTTVEIHGGMDNSNLQVGYRLNAVGVYFRNPTDNNEYLFGTAIHKSTPEEPMANFIFPFNGLTTTGLLFDLLASVGNADNISFEINPAATVTIQTLRLHNICENAHENRFSYLQSQIDGLADSGLIWQAKELSNRAIPLPNTQTHLFIVGEVRDYPQSPENGEPNNGGEPYNGGEPSEPGEPTESEPYYNVGE